MSTTGKQSPLGVNTLGSLLANTGIAINPAMIDMFGSSTGPSTTTPGSIATDTCLKPLVYAINDAYTRGYPNSGTTVSNTVYNNLITIGAATIPALGDTKPSTFNWTGYPNWASTYTYATSATQWGFTGMFAIQGYNEFNYNNGLPNYPEWLTAYMTASSFITSTNKAIMSSVNSTEFLDGTFSNMNDLITGDLTGVSLTTTKFGQDLITSGKAIDLSTLSTFGLPSNLLKTLNKFNGITQTVSLVLISVIPGNTVTEILNGAQATTEQERLMYAAFSLIVGDSLTEALVALNCKLQGLESLADLLNVQKLFPTSYETLTVPMYNTEILPTNSKTYYPIYVGGGINLNLKGTAIVEQVGSQIPAGTPPISDGIGTTDAQLIPLGFGSYLQTIMPDDIAIGCGAFSVTMLQVKNITSIPVEKLAQVAISLETMQGLTTNSTSVPVDTTLATSAISALALGSGPYGTYTMADFFGSMNGLPYVGSNVQTLITNIQTTTLASIYNDLYLATSWEAATVTVQYTLALGIYTITGLTITDSGGGYGRGSAPAPTITIAGGSGATAVATIGTSTSNMTTYGRVTTVTLTSAGTPNSTLPTVTIQCPPVATPGTNTASGTAGWPTMNTHVQTYIDSANTEISAIQTANNNKANELNTAWAALGTQLSIEQRALNTGLPIAVPYTGTLQVTATAPSAQIAFVDSVPDFALNTQPNMQAQSLEAVADICTPGGASLVAKMRETRNEARLAQVGIELDNNIPDAIPPVQQKELIANGAIPNVPSAPSTLKQVDCTTGETISPKSAGSYNPETNKFDATDPTYGSGPLDTGASEVPGSFAGSPYENITEPNLNVFYTSNTLLPAVYSVAEAIDEVVTCNCDCWKLI